MHNRYISMSLSALISTTLVTASGRFPIKETNEVNCSTTLPFVMPVLLCASSRSACIPASRNVSRRLWEAVRGLQALQRFGRDDDAVSGLYRCPWDLHEYESDCP